MSHGFDFNKLFYEGLFFLSQEDRKSLEGSSKIEKIKQKFRIDNLQNEKEYKAFHSLHWERVLNELESNIQTESEEPTEITIKFVKIKIYKYFESQLEDHFSSKGVKLVFSYDTEFLPERAKMSIKFEKVDEEENGIIGAEKEDLEDGFGFMDIIDLIIEMKKPLITHNGFLDILHFYDKFIADLPETQNDFKQGFNQNVPFLVDTKFMLNNSNVLFSKTNRHTPLELSYFEALKDRSFELFLPPEFSSYTVNFFYLKFFFHFSLIIFY
jgi:hypothetical protein